MSKRYYIPKGWRKLRIGAKINRDTDKMASILVTTGDKSYLDIAKWVNFPNAKEARDSGVIYITPKK